MSGGRYNSAGDAAGVRISFSSHIENVDRAVSEICEVCDRVSTSPVHTFSLRLVLHEVLTNAVVHGNRRDKKKSVHLAATVDGDRLTVEVKDEGPGFAKRDSSQSDDRGQPATSGRGLLLLQAYCEHVEIDDCGNSGTRLRLVKRLGTSTAD